MADRTDDYDYELPSEQIAQEPARRRDEARLMVLEGDRPPAHRVVRPRPCRKR